MFTSELNAGSVIIDNVSGITIGTVQSITDNLHLTLTSNAVIAISGAYNKKVTNTPIQVSAPNSSFVDNGNGSMTMNAATITNNYNDILVAYTYQDNNSPAIGKGYLVIRVTPNPVANFTIASTLNSPTSSTFDALCSTNPITFDASVSVPLLVQPSQAGSVNTIQSYIWNFGDVPSGNSNAAAIATAPHTFSSSSIYTVINLHCKSFIDFELGVPIIAGYCNYPCSSGRVK